jgi:prepilin-type N-terminal cleavage/methylation domain-containing protein
MKRHLLDRPVRRQAKSLLSSWTRRPGRSGGFTLFELLFVIAVLSVLIGLLVPRMQQVRREHSEAATPINLKSIGGAIDKHNADYGRDPNVISDILPYIDASFVLDGDSLFKDGYRFTLLGDDAPDAALLETSLTKIVKPGSVEKQGGKVRVEAKPHNRMVGTKKYLYHHKDGSIKSTEDPKLLAEQEKRMHEIREDGTKHLLAATKELIEGSPDTVPDTLANFSPSLKRFALESVGGDDGEASLDDFVKLAGDESLPAKDGIEKHARYLKQQLEYGVGNEKQGNDGPTLEIAGLEVTPKDTLTWDVFRQLAADYMEAGVTREALLAISYAAEKAELANPQATAAQYDALRHLIDTLLLQGSLDIKEAAELRQFLDLRSDLLAPAP